MNDKYLELVQALLKAESGTESELLATHPELVDRQLVMTLLATAQWMTVRNDPEAASTIEWLNNFATQLATYLGIELESSTDEDNPQTQLDFFVEVLQEIERSNTDPKVIYPLFSANLHHLNSELIPIAAQVKEQLSESEEGKQEIASVLVSFSNLIQQFPLGNRAINLEVAIKLYELALSVYTRAAFPEDWAMTQMNRAVAYRNRIRGERAENLDKAIELYELALSVRTRAAFPEQWAMTQMNLAVAYQQRIRGERAENLDKAIELYELALSVYTHAAFPEQWATTQMNLATAYSDRIRGERAETLDKAIELYELALSVYTLAAFPEDWAMTQMNLATAYSDRIRGERAENLDKAIELYELALSVYTRAAFPEKWATTQMNLATAYSDRIRGERAENLDKAIELYELALSVYTRAAFPEDWAMTQMNLANAYQHRIRGERAENLDKAIELYELALSVRTRAAFPEKWATTQMNLAVAYSDRIRGERAANLDKAIALYELALSVYTRAAFPEDWAMTQMNLANAYSDRIRGERAANLDKAIELYELALSVRTRAAFPEQWAQTQNNLGNVYKEIDRVNEAIDCFRSALEIRTPELLPLDCLQSSRNLGNLAFKIGDWQLAIDGYDLAIQAVETSRSWALSDDSRQSILRDAIHVYENAIQASINLHRLDLAIQYSERARSRQLVDFMMTNDLYADAEIPAEVAQYWAEYNQLDTQIRDLQQPDADNQQAERQPAQTRHRAAFDAANAEISALETQKQALWHQIRSRDAVFAQQIQVTPIDLKAIQGLITNDKTAILSFYTTDDDTHIFILTQDNAPQIHTLTGQGWGTLQLWLRQQWLEPYISDLPNWKLSMSTVLTEIANRLELDKLIAKLPQIEELIIIPHLFLHQIPFAALPLPAPLQGEAGGGYLGDKFIISHVPSCQVLKFCSDRPAVESSKNGTVENADGSLPGSGYECQQIAKLFDITADLRLQGKDGATIANLLKLLKQDAVTNCTISTHAQSRLDDPLKSGVQLAGGDLTLGLLMLSRFPQLNEVFLSCCETHLSTTKITDDVLTLSTGFLCAGARTVIGSLWSVDDLATALFSIFYYHQRYDKIDRAQALRKAQVRLRNLTGEEFKLNYVPELRTHLTEYALKIRDERDAIDPNEIEYNRLSDIYENTMTLRQQLSELSKCDRPFEHPYHWAAFTCQGMG